jgi:hypothetical protein
MDPRNPWQSTVSAREKSRAATHIRKKLLVWNKAMKYLLTLFALLILISCSRRDENNSSSTTRDRDYIVANSESISYVSREEKYTPHASVLVADLDDLKSYLVKKPIFRDGYRTFITTKFSKNDSDFSVYLIVNNADRENIDIIYAELSDELGWQLHGNSDVFNHRGDKYYPVYKNVINFGAYVMVVKEEISGGKIVKFSGAENLNGQSIIDTIERLLQEIVEEDADKKAVKSYIGSDDAGVIAPSGIRKNFAGSQLYMVRLTQSTEHAKTSFNIILILYKNEDGTFKDNGFFMPLPPLEGDQTDEWFNFFATTENSYSNILSWRSGKPILTIDLKIEDLLTNVSVSKVRVFSSVSSNNIQIDLDPLVQGVSIFSVASNGEIGNEGRWGVHNNVFMYLGDAHFVRLN